MLPAIRGFANFTNEVGRAFTEPGRDQRQRRRDQRRDQENANLTAQQNRDAERQLQTQRQEGQLNVERRTNALPISTEEALATAGVAETARENDHARATNMVEAQTDGVINTLEAATDGRVRIIDANAQGDLAKFTGWNDTIGARQDSIIRGERAQELALVDRFVGSVPQSERLSLELEKDRGLAERMQKRQMPLDWVKAATQGAAVLGTLFL